MKLSQLNTYFMLAMVGAMYKEEAGQLTIPDLFTDADMQDFYFAYMGK